MPVKEEYVLGQRDILVQQKEEWDDMMEKFNSNDDWARDITKLRTQKGNILDSVDRVITQGRMIDNVYFSQEQLQEIQDKKRQEYFDTYQLARKLNHGVTGPLNKHSVPEKLAKIKGIDKNHS